MVFWSNHEPCLSCCVFATPRLAYFFIFFIFFLVHCLSMEPAFSLRIDLHFLAATTAVVLATPRCIRSICIAVWGYELVLDTL